MGRKPHVSKLVWKLLLEGKVPAHLWGRAIGWIEGSEIARQGQKKRGKKKGADSSSTKMLIVKTAVVFFSKKKKEEEEEEILDLQKREQRGMLSRQLWRGARLCRAEGEGAVVVLCIGKDHALAPFLVIFHHRLLLEIRVVSFPVFVNVLRSRL